MSATLFSSCQLFLLTSVARSPITHYRAYLVVATFCLAILEFPHILDALGLTFDVNPMFLPGAP